VRLAEEKERLEKWINGEHQSGNPPILASVRRKVSEILRGQHMAKLITFDLRETAEGRVRLEYMVNEAAFNELRETLFGKNCYLPTGCPETPKAVTKLTQMTPLQELGSGIV